ncbi:hypothetical protein [Pseudarthrobacter sulfonivorans]|uniref:hypothetical protein n=1 Tax=Pseudarthrobacter sulfonivorans TaxID=121292 RepID=UPI00278A8684|nr:hypothetical protein [Pseudarthrobacter sulfonivorans]MDQ0000648.1 putative peptide zinc metalloprotease protein [Pseudarthrobacter sulfonivorans]
MSTVHGGPSRMDGPPVSNASAGPGTLTSPDARLPEIPVQANGVELIGETKGSGYREPPSLVRRADGQAIALTRLLYLVLEAVDGHRTTGQIADHVSARFGKLVSGDNVRTLVASQLLPLGLLRLADGSQPEVRKADPLLGMRFRYIVTDPERTRRLTAPFAVLFNPLIVVVVCTAFMAACWWVLMVKGLASATHDAFAKPGLVLLVLAVTILSAGFHEFGHAAAARRGGATPGAMGAGLYLIWPAFFTDVTDSYRLGRGGRLRTDLGGLYFNAIVAVAIMGLWWATGFDALLLVVVTQILQMIRQLLPLVRFDGYHILADATGVPDLFQRIKPTLLGLAPWRRTDPAAHVLKPWARAVVTAWVLITVPLLALSLVMMVLSLPRLLGTAWASVLAQQSGLSQALSAGDIAGAAVRALAIAAVALPIVGIGYVLIRLVRQLTAGLWQRTRGKTLQRAAAMAAVAAVTAGLAWAWWPSPDTYRPVQPYERGTLTDATTALFPAAPYTALQEGGTGNTVALWPAGAVKPTRENPQLSMVLVPHTSPADVGAERDTTAGSATAPSWVFPFNQPTPPSEDGNQALAVNTTDGSVAYDVAFALVWAEDGAPVDTTNEAYAFASCADCAAVAVGFQVVLIVGQADVIVPENLSAAANYNCLRCLTYALATQLVLTLDGPLSEDSTARLDALWAEIAEFGRNLQNIPLSDIQERLNTFKDQVKQLIQSDPSATKGAGTSQTPTTTTAPAPGPTPGSSQPPSPRTTAPGSGSGSGSGSVPTGTPAAEPTTGGSPPDSSSTEEVPATTEIAPATTPPGLPSPAPTTTGS